LEEKSDQEFDTIDLPLYNHLKTLSRKPKNADEDIKFDNFKMQKSKKKGILESEEYKNLISTLNDAQKLIIYNHREWCKNTLVNLRKGIRPQYYKLLVTGPGGTGKSYIIQLLFHITKKILGPYFGFGQWSEDEEQIVVLNATDSYRYYCMQYRWDENTFRFQNKKKTLRGKTT
jgi:RecA-family ATPase